MQAVPMKRAAPACRAPIASRCCATPTATASPRRADRCSTGLAFAVRHGAGRQRLSTSRTPTRCSRFPYTRGDDAHRRRRRRRCVDLPAGPINHHWTKNLLASARRLEALRRPSARTATSARTAWTTRQERAAIWEIDPRDGQRIASSRPACAIRTAWRGSRTTGALWTSVNERDELGSDLVPDYMTSVRDGAFYGWPYSYYGQHVDDAREAAAARPRRDGDRARLRARPAHGVARPASSRGGALPRRLRDGMFVGQHGSWNRKPLQRLQGHLRAVRGRQAERAAGRRADRLRRRDDGEAKGRPVGVAIDRRGALLVADDVGNVVWRVTARP